MNLLDIRLFCEPVADPKETFFRHIDGEESLNDFFVSLLARSDVSTVMNAIHDDIEFQSGAHLAGTQRDGLPRHPETNSKRRTLDWVIRDSEKLVGYESKTNGGLGESQLEEERRKLEVNTEGKDVYLYAITEDLRKPELSVDYSWFSWHNVAEAVIDIDNKSSITKTLSDMLENNGYGRFSGFTPYERDEGWFITHQNEAVDFALEAAKYAKEVRFYDKNRIDLHNRVKSDIINVKNNDYQCMGPSYFVFPNHPEGYREAKTSYNIRGDYGWYIAVVIPALHNEVYVQLDTYLSKNEEFPKMFEQYAEEITDLVMSEGMSVWTSWNSIFKEETPTKHDDPEQIQNIFENKGGEGRYKRIRIGWEVDTDQPPDNIVEIAAHKMERLHDLFYEGVNMRESF